MTRAARILITDHDPEERVCWLSDVLDKANDAIIITGLQGHIDYFNRGSERLLGWTANDVLGSRPSEFFFETVQFKRAQAKLLDHGHWSGELRVHTKSGAWLVVHSRWTLVREPETAVPHVALINTNITELKRAEEELRLLPRRILEAQAAERLRVSRDLHDSVNPILAAARIQLHCLKRSIAGFSNASADAIGRCDELLAQALEANRHVAHNLRPNDLDLVGLAGACRSLCQQFKARTNLAVKTQLGRLNGPLSPAVELNLFRILQEALANAEKHAGARSVQVRLRLQGDVVCLAVRDDGCGFNTAAALSANEKPGLGLTNMRERAAAIGGHLEVLSAPGRGTRITLRAPTGRRSEARETLKL